jgi:hypothetical protein
MSPSSNEPGVTIRTMSEMTRQQLLGWIEGHEIANRRQQAVLAAMSAEEKLLRISRLMASAHLFDMSRRRTGDEAVREIWKTLRDRWAAGQ